MTRPTTILALSLVLALGAAAQAQTGTAATATAPNTSSLGRVMPPSRGAREATPADRRPRAEAKNDKIMRGICIGCAAK
jgi:hypothetical protein